MGQVLAMDGSQRITIPWVKCWQLMVVVNGRQNNWGMNVHHAGCTCQTSVSAATDLAPIQVYMNRLPGLAVIAFRHLNVSGH